jgi:hypothetical protein
MESDMSALLEMRFAPVMTAVMTDFPAQFAPEFAPERREIILGSGRQ